MGVIRFFVFVSELEPLGFCEEDRVVPFPAGDAVREEEARLTKDATVTPNEGD